MSNSFHNHLKLSADSESIIESAKQIFEKWAAKWTTNTAATSEVFDKQNELHICEYHFILSSPPSDLYAELKAIEGIKLEATFTSDMQHYDERYRWTGEGDKYEVLETGLTYPEEYARTVRAKEVRVSVSGHIHKSLVAYCELLTNQVKQLPSTICLDRKLQTVVLDAVIALYNLADDSSQYLSEEEIPF